MGLTKPTTSVLGWALDVAFVAVCAAISFLLWRLEMLFHWDTWTIVAAFLANVLIFLGLRLARRIVAIGFSIPLLIILAVGALYFAVDSVLSACPREARLSEICGYVHDGLPATGQTRLIVRSVKFDHIDRRVARDARQLVQQAIEGVRHRITVYADGSTASSIVDRTGDIILTGVAEALDPQSSLSGRYRALITLGRRTSSGETETLGQFRTGSLHPADGFVVDVAASKDASDPELLLRPDVETSIGRTTLDGCREFNRNCYRDEAIKHSLGPLRSRTGTLVRLVVIETEPNQFLSLASYLPARLRPVND